MATTSSWKKRIEKGIPRKHYRDRRRWYDGHDTYKRRHWVLVRKKGVRFVAFPGVRRQSSSHSYTGDSCDDIGGDDDDEDETLFDTFTTPSQTFK